MPHFLHTSSVEHSQWSGVVFSLKPNSFQSAMTPDLNDHVVTKAWAWWVFWCSSLCIPSCISMGEGEHRRVNILFVIGRVGPKCFQFTCRSTWPKKLRPSEMKYISVCSIWLLLILWSSWASCSTIWLWWCGLAFRTEYKQCELWIHFFPISYTWTEMPPSRDFYVYRVEP